MRRAPHRPPPVTEMVIGIITMVPMFIAIISTISGCLRWWEAILALLAGLAVAWAGNWLIANWNKRVFPGDER